MADRATRALNRAARAVDQRGSGADRAFERLVWVLAISTVALLIGVVVLLVADSGEALGRYGLGFFVTTTWDPVFERFGAGAFLYGTLVTSLIGLMLATPVGVGAALFLVEYAPGWVRTVIGFLVEMLAAIPSIIYGLWAFFVLAPLMRSSFEPALKAVLTDVPLLGALVQGPPIGKDLLTAGVVLAIMILPTIMAVSREVIATVPDTQREGMIALGATRWETIQRAVLPYARSGIIGAAMLGLARALGETMAVTMVIGNSSTHIKASLFTPGYTMASVIANQFTEADKAVYFSALVYVALALLVVTLVVNLAARLLVLGLARGAGEGQRA